MVLTTAVCYHAEDSYKEKEEEAKPQEIRQGKNNLILDCLSSLALTRSDGIFHVMIIASIKQ